MGERVAVETVEELRRVVAKATPGTRIEVAPGEYRGGLHFVRVRGAAGRPVRIVGADPTRPPIFRGGGTGLQFSGAAHLELADLAVEGASDNGLNIDDGGAYDLSAVGVVLRRISVRDIGPRGNHDGIKLSGLKGFRVEQCIVERWGVGSGCGIDMVGCHRGVIEGCTLRHRDAADTGASGVQIKGGCREITVRRCRFENVGGRGVNVGGSTGLPYFRPRLRGSGPFSEAAEITVEGCVFDGGDTPLAFVGADGATARFNTIHLPRRWALRILQETRAPGFAPCRNAAFESNLVVFESGRWFEGGVNVGPGTEPKSFRFARNAWLCRDRPERTRDLVRLPAAERDGDYGRAPVFLPDLWQAPGSPLRGFGADALPT